MYSHQFQLHLFISRLGGPPIGLSAIGLFTIDKSFILTVSISNLFSNTVSYIFVQYIKRKIIMMLYTICDNDYQFWIYLVVLLEILKVIHHHEKTMISYVTIRPVMSPLLIICLVSYFVDVHLWQGNISRVHTACFSYTIGPVPLLALVHFLLPGVAHTKGLSRNYEIICQINAPSATLVFHTIPL